MADWLSDFDPQQFAHTLTHCSPEELAAKLAGVNDVRPDYLDRVGGALMTVLAVAHRQATDAGLDAAAGKGTGTYEGTSEPLYDIAEAYARMPAMDERDVSAFRLVAFVSGGPDTSLLDNPMWRDFLLWKTALFCVMAEYERRGVNPADLLAPKRGMGFTGPVFDA